MSRLQRQQDFISEVRKHATALLAAQLALEALQTEWNAQDYSTSLADGEGDNSGVTAAAVGQVVFDTTNAVRGLLDAGHATNLTNLL